MISFYRTEAKVFNANLPKNQSDQRRKSSSLNACSLNGYFALSIKSHSLAMSQPKNWRPISIQLNPPFTDFRDAEIGHA